MTQFQPHPTDQLQTATAEPNSKVPGISQRLCVAADDLEAKTSRLAELVAEVEARLEPILGHSVSPPDKPIPGDVAPDPTNGFGRLEQATIRIAVASAKLESCLQAL